MMTPDHKLPGVRWRPRHGSCALRRSPTSCGWRATPSTPSSKKQPSGSGRPPRCGMPRRVQPTTRPRAWTCGAVRMCGGLARGPCRGAAAPVAAPAGSSRPPLPPPQPAAQQGPAAAHRATSLASPSAQRSLPPLPHTPLLCRSRVARQAAAAASPGRRSGAVSLGFTTQESGRGASTERCAPQCSPP